PLLDRDPPERTLQLVAIDDGQGMIRGRRSFHRQDPDASGPVPGPRRLVVAGMNEDPMDPRLEAVCVPQPRELPPGEDEGVLQRVLGETRVAQDPERDREERIADLVHQDGERLTVAPTGPFDEVSIHLDLRLPRPEWPRSPSLTERHGSNVQIHG